MKSFLSYVGGKSRLADMIVKAIPEHTCYCEVFAGAAWVFFRKEPSKTEILNDKDTELINLYRIIQHYCDEFLRQFKYLFVSRKIFVDLKRQDLAGLTDIQRAVRYFYLLKTSFGGSALVKSTFGYGTTGPSRLNLVTLEEVILQIHLRLLRVTVECLDWKDCIQRYDRPHTLFYLDPPYYGTKDYAHNFEKEDYVSLAEALQGIQGKFLLSLNDVPFIQATFKEFRGRPLEVRYSRARKESSRAHLRGELFISNF